MVFFTCNTCGTSLKKNQVEKHYQNECRNCEVLSCMDCGKDFYGNEYAGHTKCISEAEKYQGALYKENGGGGASKGEKKQQEWLERVKQSTSTAKVSLKIASLLERISEYPNIPRKRKKFENFVRNSINVRHPSTLSELWDAFSGATEEGKADERTEAAPVTNDRGNGETPITQDVDRDIVPSKMKKSKDRENDGPLEDQETKLKIKKKARHTSSEEVTNPKLTENAGLESEHSLEVQPTDSPKKKKKKHKDSVPIHEETPCNDVLQSKKKKRKRSQNAETETCDDDHTHTGHTKKRKR